MMDMTLWWGGVRRDTFRAHLSAWQLHDSAPQVSPIPDTSSILLTQSSSRGKFAKLSCSVRRFHKGSFFKRLQVFFHFCDVDSTALHLSIEMIGSIENISHVRQNENELGICEAM